MTKVSVLRPGIPGVEYGNAICYSGYRENQSPRSEDFPSYDEICEDLGILEQHWRYLRIYDSSYHAELVLRAIRDEGFDLRVMLGSDLRAERSNPECPWGAEYSSAELVVNRRFNDDEIDRMIAFARDFPDLVFAVSVGNEATVEWTDNQVTVERLFGFVRRIRREVPHPVTCCENYVPWTGKLEPLVAELDFISLHTYPVWEYQGIEDALEYTRQNYYSVASRYPGTPVIITEAGWTTRSNGRGIEPDNANEELQAEYYRQLVAWSEQQKILTFVFEAFDEPWKGSPDPLEPEKHWGIFTVDRQPKLVMRDTYAHLAVATD